MKKSKKQGIVVALLAVVMATILGFQAKGNPSSSVRQTLQKPSSAARSGTLTARLEDSTIGRDPFWHPDLVEKVKEPVAPPVVQVNPPKASLPMPEPMQGGNYWIPPVTPDVTNLRPTGSEPPAASKPIPPREAKVEEPKKSLRVCGFLATQTPKIILSMNGEEPMTCGEGDTPWPNVKILKVEMDRATLKWEKRLVTVTAGQEVQK